MELVVGNHYVINTNEPLNAELHVGAVVELHERRHSTGNCAVIYISGPGEICDWCRSDGETFDWVVEAEDLDPLDAPSNPSSEPEVNLFTLSASLGGE